MASEPFIAYLVHWLFYFSLVLLLFLRDKALLFLCRIWYYCKAWVLRRWYGRNDWRYLLLWTDATPAVTKRLAKTLGADASTFGVVPLDNPEHVGRFSLRPSLIGAICLLVTDVSKLSESEKVRTRINGDLRKYVEDGGGIVGAHDLIYRRTRNQALEEVFGAIINQFARTEARVIYQRNPTKKDHPIAKFLPDEFALSDGEVISGDWKSDCEVIYQTKNSPPSALVVAREYGKGKVVWLNSGDYKSGPPDSISIPEDGFVELLKASILWVSQTPQW